MDHNQNDIQSPSTSQTYKTPGYCPPYVPKLHQKNCADLDCPFPQCKNYTGKKYTFNIPDEDSDDCDYKTNTNCKCGCQNSNIKYNTSLSNIDPNDIIGTTFIVDGNVIEVGLRKSVCNDIINKKIIS